MTVLYLRQKYAATVVCFQIRKLRPIKRRKDCVAHASGFCFGLVLCGKSEVCCLWNRVFAV